MAGTNPSDSALELSRLARASKRRISWPSGIATQNRKSRGFFRNILEERAKADWNRHTIDVAAHLSNAMASAAELQEELTHSGLLADGRVSPLHAALDRSFRTIIALRRTLGLGESSNVTNLGQKARARKTRVTAEQALTSTETDFDMFDGIN